MALMVGVVQTFEGWLFVVLQMVAVNMLAAPSAPFAIALDGSLSAAATWAQVWPDSTWGLYWAPCTKYLPPKSMNGMAPASLAETYGGASYFVISAFCALVSFSSGFSLTVSCSTGVKVRYLLVYLVL